MINISVKLLIFFVILFFYFQTAAQNRVLKNTDSYLTIAKDARALGQGDIGVSTSTDVFSQYWNPSKYVFSEKKTEIGITYIHIRKDKIAEIDEFSQLNLAYYNKPNNRSAYAISTRNVWYRLTTINGLNTSYRVSENSFDGSYTIKLSDKFAMSVGGRFISLRRKEAQIINPSYIVVTNLYGIDVSGFYYGNEIAYKKYNGRWRAGFNFSNIRSKSINDQERYREMQSYAPSMLTAGVGFDIIPDNDHIFGITTEYKTFLNLYGEDFSNQIVNSEVYNGGTIAAGLEYTIEERISMRTGYSQGINKKLDTFFSLGAGVVGRYYTIDIAYLPVLIQQENENPIRKKLRFSINLDLVEIF